MKVLFLASLLAATNVATSSPHSIVSNATIVTEGKENDGQPECRPIVRSNEDELSILVTSATGRVGKEVIARLRMHSDKKIFIRAGTRDGPDSKSGTFLQSIGADEVVRFDFADATTFPPALMGINVVYDSSPDPLDGSFDLVTQHRDFVLSMDPQKVKHVVRLSCIGTRLEHSFNEKELLGHSDYGSPCVAEGCMANVDEAVETFISIQNNPYKILLEANETVPHVMRAYAYAEKIIIERGIPLTSVRGGFFMGHFLKAVSKSIVEQGFFQTPFGAFQKPDISTNDIGDMCAELLVGNPPSKSADKYGALFYEVTGSRSESTDDILAHLTNALEQLGRPLSDFGRAQSSMNKTLSTITYKDISESITEETKAKIGKARYDFVSYLLRHREISDHVFPDFHRVMKRLPESYDTYLSNPGAAGGTGLEDIFSFL